MPLVDLASFRASAIGAEFAQLPDEQVQDALDDAAVSTPADPWGSYQAEGHKLLAAHTLALSPMGNSARLEEAGDQTTYGVRFERLKRLVGCGTRVF